MGVHFYTKDNLREFVLNSRHLDPGRAWKRGTESYFMTPDPADPVDPLDPLDPLDPRMSSKKLKVDGRHSTWGKLARKMRSQVQFYIFYTNWHQDRAKNTS